MNEHLRHTIKVEKTLPTHSNDHNPRYEAHVAFYHTFSSGRMSHRGGFVVYGRTEESAKNKAEKMIEEWTEWVRSRK